jgi:YegS/Rv2252/BmrU family lipid kinase
MTAKVIFNPYSNRWKAGELRSTVEAELKSAGIEFELVTTERRFHGTELTVTAVKAGFSPIIAAGGDGTIGEVINGLFQAQGEGKLGPLGILPLGTANDLVHNIKAPLDLPEAVKVIAGGKSRPMDIIGLNGMVFGNNSGIGLEPYVTTIEKKMKHLKGLLRYLTAALLGIKDNPHWNVTMEWDGGEYKGPASLVSVGNGAVTGGLFYMAPHADPFDGKLTFLMGHRGTRFGALKLLPKLMQPEGNVVHEKDVMEVHATRLRIHLDRPAPAHMDGELFPDWMQDFEYSIFPSKLQILTK